MVYKDNEKKITAVGKQEIHVMKKCPVCDRRIFDKITPTTGTIALKCPHCHKVVQINLALRRCPNLYAHSYN